MAGMWVGLVIVIILFLVLLAMALKVVAQYERRDPAAGSFVGIREPGLRVIIPFVDRMWKVDTRIVTMDVPAQEVITKDNVTIKVDAVVYLRVVNADSAVLKVADYVRATSLYLADHAAQRAGPVGSGMTDCLTATNSTPGCSRSLTSRRTPGASR